MPSESRFIARLDDSHTPVNTTHMPAMEPIDQAMEPVAFRNHQAWRQARSPKGRAQLLDRREAIDD
jgi:hypothetical protein